MPDVALRVAHLPPGIALIPGPVELLGRPTELHHEIAREILRLGLAPFLAPQADQSGLIITHDDPGVRAADERASIAHIAFPAINNGDTLGAGRLVVNTSGI